MQAVYRLIELAAPTAAPVLIAGESGTGKELVARSLHSRSPRGAGPFVAVNCAAIPETLMESELFGHEKGAFTGAAERRAGCFERAHGGTLLLDELAEMAPATQAKFLRILQEGRVRRLGGQAEMPVEVRVVAATNRDPLQALQTGTLREDLYYRLNVLTITLPPLRERREDLPLLLQAFLAEFAAKYGRPLPTLDPAAQQLLWQHPWPGNVRELRNTLERAVITCAGPRITPAHLPPTLTGPAAPGADPVALTLAVGTTVEETKKALILQTLAAVENNKARAAAVLGISLKTLHNKLHRYGRFQKSPGPRRRPLPVPQSAGPPPPEAPRKSPLASRGV
jgi:transcriptional regulator with PAS, ATPase and Fis domain